MSLRHCKKADKQISEMQHGFEAHSSMSHRVLKQDLASKAKSEQQQTATRKQQEASALRLEAGRISRNSMLRKTEKRIEHGLGAALVKTFAPIQKILRHDERSLDSMLSHKDEERLTGGIVDAEALRIKRQLRHKLRLEADTIIKRKKLAAFHKSHAYLQQVHDKVKEGLNHIVDPAIFRMPTTAEPVFTVILNMSSIPGKTQASLSAQH